jgi:hypothetical protein
MPANTQILLDLVRFKFTPEELAVLAENKAEWQEANRTDRRAIAGRVYQDLKKTNPQWSPEDRDLKKEVGLSIPLAVKTVVIICFDWQGVYTWFHMYGRKRASAEKFKDIKTWTARSVLAVEAEEELKAIIRENTGGWAGSLSGKRDNQKAFGTYQTELSTLWKTTSDSERERLEAVAKIWNQMGPPPEQQAKSTCSTCAIS